MTGAPPGAPTPAFLSTEPPSALPVPSMTMSRLGTAISGSVSSSPGEQVQSSTSNSGVGGV